MNDQPTHQPPQQVANPFGSATPAAQENAAALSDAERAAQEVQAKLVIAKKFPRDPVLAMDRIVNACCRPSLAASALYLYSRGGTEITGPSIRLAEAMAQAWGNIDFGIRELSSANGWSSVEAFAWDMETNTRQSKTFQVPHVRYTKNGGVKDLVDPRDIYEQVANQGARRLRACILGVIPGDVTETAVAQCHTTQAANIDTTPEAQAKLVSIFGKYGVSKELLEARIQRRLEAIQPAQMQSLLNIARSIRDGMSKPDEWFDVGPLSDDGAAETSDLNAELQASAEQTPDTEGDAGGAGEGDQVGEDTTEGAGGVPIMAAEELQAVMDEIKAAKTQRALKEHRAGCRKLERAGRVTRDQLALLLESIKKRAQELRAHK